MGSPKKEEPFIVKRPTCFKKKKKKKVPDQRSEENKRIKKEEVPDQRLEENKGKKKIPDQRSEENERIIQKKNTIGLWFKTDSEV